MRFPLHSAVILMSCLALIFSSCKEKSRAGAADGKLKVVCTIGMITDLVENISGGLAEVKGLMGPGVDPHLYKATPGDVGALQKADIIFYNGLHLESKMGELFEKMGTHRTTVAVTRSLPESELISPEGFSSLHDPHVWFDVTLWKSAVSEVERALSQKKPASAELFGRNAAAYRLKLDSLHNWVTQMAQSIAPEQRVLITAHDAFGYFGKRYGFEVVGLQGISTEAEAGTSDVQALVNLIVTRKIKAIFIESSVPEKNIKAVQEAVRARGWEVAIGGELFSDAMGDKATAEGTYIGMVSHNMATITRALTGKALHD